MTTITLAQARKVVSVTGDTISVSLDTTPTIGNTLVALIAAEGENLYSAYPSNPEYPWQAVDHETTTTLMAASFVARMDLPRSIENSDFSTTVAGADRITVHLYEIEEPPQGFAFSQGFMAPSGVLWTETVTPTGSSTSLSFASFPLFAGDFDMGACFMAVFSEHLANTTSEPTITPDFGGNIGPATYGGRVASEFASVGIEDSLRTWSLAWTEAQPETAIVMAMGQIAEKTSFSLVQRKASLTESTTLSTAPAVGNLLVASLAVTDDEVVPAQAGWNRIVGPADSSGQRICIFWREVIANQSTAISFEAPSCIGMSVEEWSGFYGSPFVHSSALGGASAFGSGGDTEGLGAMAALLAPIGLLDRITYTTVVLSDHPDGGISLGGQYQTGISGQRVFAGGSGSSINTNYYPTLGGGTWDNATSLDAFGLVVVFGDGAEAVAVDEPVDPEDPGTGPYVFPEEGSRLVFDPPARQGSALMSARGVQGYVYLDAEGTTLAVITDLDDEVISGSLVEVDADSKLPLFRGPGSVKTLYIRWANSEEIYPVYARNQSAPAPTATSGFFSDLPLLTFEEVIMGGAEFTVLGSFGASPDTALFQILAARVQPPEGTEFFISGTAFAEMDEGEPTGRFIFNGGSTGIAGGEAKWANIILPNMMIVNVLTGDYTAMAMEVGDPAEENEGFINSGFAASQGWVASKLAGIASDAGGGGYLDATTFGVEADTGDDQWSAITDAIEAAQAQGKNVLLPPGVIFTHRKVVLPSGVGLSGAGIDRTTLTKPPTVSSVLTAKVFQNDTTAQVQDASVFSVGDPLHLYSTEHFEWDSTQAIITAVDTDADLIEFDPPAWSEYIVGGFACTSFGLIGNYVPVNAGEDHPGTVGGFITDLTLDHNRNEFDPAENDVDPAGVVSFPISTLHLEMARFFRTERVKFINVAGDAYSDQGRDFWIGPNNNVVRSCIFDSPFRHAVHLGTGNGGARVENNIITGCRNGVAMFYCANVTRSVASGNFVWDCIYGMSHVDGRDKWNSVVNNTFHNCTQPLRTGNPEASDDEAFGLVFDGNMITNDSDSPGAFGDFSLDLPGIVFSNNRLHNLGLRVSEGAGRAVVMGNHFSADLVPPVGAGEIGLAIEAPDCIVSGNEFHNFNIGVSIFGASQLLLSNNVIIPNSVTPSEFVFHVQVVYVDSTDVRIEGTHPIAYSAGGTATRLVANGIGSNGEDDPNVSGPWHLPGAKYNGAVVQHGSEGISKISMYVHGTGWIEIGSV